MSWVWLAPAIIGVCIFLMGIGFAIWGRREEKRYYDSLTTRPDLREFVSHWPPRIEPGALKTGGWIGVVVGLAAGGIALVLYLINR
jgi:hypothetical protein